LGRGKTGSFLLRTGAFHLCLALLFCLQLPGCKTISDPDQVQVVTAAADFQPFTDLPRTIVHGPYSLKVTTDSAIIAWEEASWTQDTRHVEVSLSGLSPGTEYVYRVNGAEKDGRFVTAPDDGSPFSFFIIGDTQNGPDISRGIAENMLQKDPNASFFLHMGDCVGDGMELEAWETEWWDPLGDLLLRLPVYPATGNHEKGSPYYIRYCGSLGDNASDYSFDWGGAHFVVFGFHESLSADDPEIVWLEQELQNHQDNDFLVVIHHLPPYDAAPSDEAADGYIQEILVPLYERCGVDLVLSGHVHGYQHHIKNSIHYLVSAGGGGRMYDYGLPLDGMTLALYKSYNFSRCSLAGDALHITTYDPQGAVLDDCTIEKNSFPDIQTRVLVTADKQEVSPGEQFTVAVFVQGADNLDNASFSLAFYKDEPPMQLTVIDAAPDEPGVQIEQGNLNGSVAANRADNSTGIITYTEQETALCSCNQVLVASATFAVPENARATAFYLVPRCRLRDASGGDIIHFMGGAKVVIKK